jgi:sterol desaturase/sphingolipid hydroxylase (fatty acid hydroxylase superfamily)
MEVIGILDLPILLAFYLKVSLTNVFIAAKGQLSFARLSLSVGIGILAFALFYQRKSRNIRFKALLRAILPTKYFGASSRADVLMFLFNLYLIGLLLGWAFLSQHVIATFANETLQTWFGSMAPTSLSPWVTGAVMTAAVFIAADFSYWFDHFLSHKIPFLWQFHRVHHTAEVLTPITNFRVHPMDSLVYYNLMAILIGVTEGSATYLFGGTIQQFTIWNMNTLIVISALLVQQLHHTSFWIPFTGVWGRIFISPAHHQIHHSLNPIHYDKNMGGTLSVFDWLFGTLHIPSKKREKLTYGVNDATARAHSAEELLVTPLIDAAKMTVRSVTRRFRSRPQPDAVPPPAAAQLPQ